jgi:hypothetical protein
MIRHFFPGFVLSGLILTGPALAWQSADRAYTDYPATVSSVRDVIRPPGRSAEALAVAGMSTGELTLRMNAAPGLPHALAVVVEFDSGERREIVVDPDDVFFAGQRVICR